MKLEKHLLEKILKIRRYLHQYPELSGNEKNTSATISEYLSQTNPSEIIRNIGGHGLAAIYDSGKSGLSVLFRADLDALPIQESNNFKYRSSVTNVAHLCGHDGHSAILVGLANIFKNNRLEKGRVILLFQPSEETGQGAGMVIKDKKFSKITPDYSFALHNLPGFERGTFCFRQGSFASASTGMIVNLKGLSSHAAHPEDGNNPDKTLAKLILKINEINAKKEKFKDFALITVIHAKLGEQAFGTTPGRAVIMSTLRTYLNDDMATLKSLITEEINEICRSNNISYDISYTEEFPATINDIDCVKVLKKSAKSYNIPIHELNFPFRWSEDFGHFTSLGKAALFGIGAGTDHPQLHNENYDFPDEIMEPAINIYIGVLQQLGIIEKIKL